MKWVSFIFCVLTFSFTSYGEVTYKEFLNLKDVTHKVFKELRPDETHQLLINPPFELNETYWWDIDALRAAYHGYENIEENIYQHYIYIFGGYAKQKFMTLDGLALTICHELGHAFAGAPFKNNGASVEAQSDYFAAKTCLPLFFKYMASTDEFLDDNYVYNLCEKSAPDQKFCLRAFKAFESMLKYFESLGEVAYFHDIDRSIVEELNTNNSFYPNAQCRIDTMIQGLLNKERPLCWYPGGVQRRL